MACTYQNNIKIYYSDFMETQHSRTCSLVMADPHTVCVSYADNKSIELRDAIGDYHLYDRFTKQKKLKRLMVMGHFSAFTLRARSFFNDETFNRKDRILADAIVISGGFLQRLSALIYMITFSKFFPVKIFKTEHAALNWLQSLEISTEVDGRRLAF